jgi:hypothetical protein
VTASLIAPVIPPAVRVPARARGGGDGVRRLPLAGPSAGHRCPEGVVYGLGRIDASGRVADRTVLRALGWRGGDRLTLTAEAGVVTARRDPGGMVIVPARPYVVIPAGLRRRCGLRAGDRVLLAALLVEDALAAYPLAVVDQAIRALHSVPAAPGGAR